jgi:hypothetical protein
VYGRVPQTVVFTSREFGDRWFILIFSDTISITGFPLNSRASLFQSWPTQRD